MCAMDTYIWTEEHRKSPARHVAQLGEEILLEFGLSCACFTSTARIACCEGGTDKSYGEREGRIMSLSFVMNQLISSVITRKEQVNEAVEKEKEERHAKSIALNALSSQYDSKRTAADLRIDDADRRVPGDACRSFIWR